MGIYNLLYSQNSVHLFRRLSLQRLCYVSLIVFAIIECAVCYFYNKHPAANLTLTIVSIFQLLVKRQQLRLPRFVFHKLRMLRNFETHR